MEACFELNYGTWMKIPRTAAVLIQVPYRFFNSSNSYNKAAKKYSTHQMIIWWMLNLLSNAVDCLILLERSSCAWWSMSRCIEDEGHWKHKCYVFRWSSCVCWQKLIQTLYAETRISSVLFLVLFPFLNYLCFHLATQMINNWPDTNLDVYFWDLDM